MDSRNRWLREILTLATLGTSILGALPAFAQHNDGSHHTHTPSSSTQTGNEHPDMSDMSEMGHTEHHHKGGNSTVTFLLEQSSGTGFQPSAWPMPGRMDQIGLWHLMTMGQTYIVGTQQGGPRGKDRIYSSNWVMVAGAHPLGQGAVMVRTMLSLEPLTVSDRQYPLLFQTGETAFGQPIVDGQHPHDLFMELGVQYAHPLGKQGMINIYYAPVGDVALGPIAFPHRASDLDLIRSVQTGVGTNVTVYLPDKVLQPFYGKRPWGANLFVRLRLK